MFWREPRFDRSELKQSGLGIRIFDVHTGPHKFLNPIGQILSRRFAISIPVEFEIGPVFQMQKHAIVAAALAAPELAHLRFQAAHLLFPRAPASEPDVPIRHCISITIKYKCIVVRTQDHDQAKAAEHQQKEEDKPAGRLIDQNRFRGGVVLELIELRGQIVGIDVARIEIGQRDGTPSCDQRHPVRRATLAAVGGLHNRLLRVINRDLLDHVAQKELLKLTLNLIGFKPLAG